MPFVFKEKDTETHKPTIIFTHLDELCSRCMGVCICVYMYICTNIIYKLCVYILAHIYIHITYEYIYMLKAEGKWAAKSYG